MRAVMLSSACIFEHKIYSRKRENKYLLWFVAETGVLHNTIEERVDADPFSSWYLVEAYNMVNHMLVVVSRCFVPRTTKVAQISTPHIKTFWIFSRHIQHESVAFQAHLHPIYVSQAEVPS